MEDLSLKEKIQLVIDTLQQINIPATYENMNHLMACLQLLCQIRDSEEVKPDVIPG